MECVDSRLAKQFRVRGYLSDHPLLGRRLLFREALSRWLFNIETDVSKIAPHIGTFGRQGFRGFFGPGSLLTTFPPSTSGYGMLSKKWWIFRLLLTERDPFSLPPN